METMRADTRAITIPASYEAAFAFLTDPENLPTWAVGSPAPSGRTAKPGWSRTGQGEIPIRYEVDAASAA